MNFTPTQSAAIKKIVAWVRSRSGPQVMRMFGYAGTGKTTLARQIADEVPGTLFGAFTGKASLVLRQKGCSSARTIHSMIYKSRFDEITGAAAYNWNPDSDVAGATLVCIDEVSMVGPDLGKDLLRYGTKVLVLGDPAQLPPVNGEGFFIDGTPDIMLTEVHRQAAENPIIAMSMTVRTGGRLVPGEYGASRVIRRADLGQAAMREIVMSADQMLVGRNATRTTFNGRVREIRFGTKDPAPRQGDKLVCLRNNHLTGLLNGGLWTVAREPSLVGDAWAMRVESLDEEGVTLDVSTHAAYFDGTQADLNWKTRRKQDEFTYGYALTVHKSQGSSWPHVLVVDESSAFREHAANHLYTALTRASDRVTVVV